MKMPGCRQWTCFAGGYSGSTRSGIQNGMMFTEMRLLSRRNIWLEAIKKTVPITPMTPGLKPTYGREHPGHVIGFTRLMMIISHPRILSIHF
jgi:hypothetical protein